MIWRDAIRSLRYDKTRSFFYWLTFVIASMFMFLFFNISMSEALKVTFVDARNDLATNITLFVIVLASIDLFFANDFFVKNKAKSLAVQLVCGARYGQLASFLLVQTAILLILAIPVGIILGIISMPVVNRILATVLMSSAVISISLEAVGYMAFVMLYVIFWTTLLNLSFAYRNSAAMLLNDNGIGVSIGLDMPVPLKTRTRKILCLALFLLPIPLFCQGEEGTLLYAIASLAGLLMTIGTVILPWLDENVEKHINDPIAAASLGFLRSDFKKMNKNIILHLVASVILLSSAIVSQSPIDVVLVTVSFCVMNCVQSLSVMFTFFTMVSLRAQDYMTLWQLGFAQEQFTSIVDREVAGFYGFLIATGILYLANITIPAIRIGKMEMEIALIMAAGYLLPLSTMALISRAYYNRMVKRELRKIER